MKNVYYAANDTFEVLKNGGSMYFTFARQRVIIKTTKEKTNKKGQTQGGKHYEEDYLRKNRSNLNRVLRNLQTLVDHQPAEYRTGIKNKENKHMKKTILEKIEATLAEYYGTYRH